MYRATDVMKMLAIHVNGSNLLDMILIKYKTRKNAFKKLSNDNGGPLTSFQCEFALSGLHSMLCTNVGIDPCSLITLWQYMTSQKATC